MNEKGDYLAMSRTIIECSTARNYDGRIQRFDSDSLPPSELV